MTKPTSAPSTVKHTTLYDRLAYFPVALFSSVMGVAGLALAWTKASHVLGAPAEAGLLLRTAATGLYGKRPPNALLARGWIQVQAVVGAAGCQRWGSREEMSACLVVGRRVMTSRRYA